MTQVTKTASAKRVERLNRNIEGAADAALEISWDDVCGEARATVAEIATMSIDNLDGNGISIRDFYRAKDDAQIYLDESRALKGKLLTKKEAMQLARRELLKAGHFDAAAALG